MFCGAASFSIMTAGRAWKSDFAYHLGGLHEGERHSRLAPSLPSPPLPNKWKDPPQRAPVSNEPSPCLHLFRQGGRNQQAGTDQILSKNDISRNSCRLWHCEERSERARETKREREGGEQLTRSDTGKRGDLIAQLAKSTGRKQQERLVPSVWPGSLLLLVGPSVPPTPQLLLPLLLLLLLLLLPSSFPHCCLSRLTTSEQNDQLSPPHEHGSSW